MKKKIPVKPIHMVRLRVGQKRPPGYQYRYRNARGLTPWFDGDEELYKIPITAGTGIQYRAPEAPKARRVRKASKVHA